MLSFVTVISADYTHVVAAVIATYGVVRTWFAKEIAAGKAELAKVESVVKADASKVETAVTTELKKL